MSRHLWWSDILSGRSQNRGLDTLRFTAAPRYPFKQLKSSFAFRCSLHLQQSILHTCSRDQSGVLHCAEPFQPSLWNSRRVTSYCPPLRVPAFTQRHKQRLLPGQRKAARFLCLKSFLPLQHFERTLLHPQTKGFEGTTELIFSTPVASGAYIRNLAASLAWPGHVSRTRALTSPDQRVSALVQHPTLRPSSWLSIGMHSLMLSA